MDDQNLAKHSIIMVITTMAANFFSYIYQLLMGRLLSKEEYGILYSLLSLMYIINVGGSTIQTAIARYVSKLKARRDYGKMRYLWEFSVNRTILFGLAFSLLLSLLSPLLSQFFNISNEWYMVLLAFSLIFSFALPANLGLLMGLQKFMEFGISNDLWALMKLLFGVSFVLVGFGVYGALLPIAIANISVFLITFVFIRNLMKNSSQKFEMKDIYSYSTLALLAIFSYTAMTYVDVLLAKHYLDANLSGDFAALAVLGKIVLFAPAGIVIAMFPKTSESFERNESHSSLLFRALLYTVVLGGFVSLLYLLFPQLIAWIMFGDKYLSITSYMFPYGVAMLMLSVVTLLTNYALSVHKSRVAYPVFLSLIIEILLLSIFHSNISEMINSILASNAVAIALIALYLKMSNSKGGP